MRKTSLLALAALSLPWVASSEERPPNILWIIPENVKLDFGCYGAEQVHTPNVDRLAAEGLRYTNVFSTSPVCAPSRSAFFVGMYQTTTDTHHMRSHREDDYRLPEGVRPLTHRLQDIGYHTVNLVELDGEIVGTGKLDLNFVNEGELYQSKEWPAAGDERPFFIQVNMPEAEYDIYDRQTWKAERALWVGEEDPDFPTVATVDNVTPPPYYPDHPIVREEWARYLNSVSHMDTHIGTILKRLEKDGTLEDTVILLFGDNGRLEARGIHWCYDSGLHVPMIVRWPRNHPAPPQIQPGAVNDDVVSVLDVTATTLAIAGITPPAGMQSRNFLGENAAPARTYAFSARDRVDETEAYIRTVRDKRYRYIRNYPPYATFTSLNRYKDKCFLVKPLMRELHAQGKLTGAPLALMRDKAPEEELYDIDSDPHEIENLAESEDPVHREALIRLRAALDTWMTESGDRGYIPEPDDVVAPFEKEMHDWFGTPEWALPGGAK